MASGESLATTDLDLARAVAQAALATEGVHDLGRGTYVEAATYGASEKVSGVVVEPEEVRVHVIAARHGGTPLNSLAGRIRQNAEPAAGGKAVSVTIEDIFWGEEL